MRRAIDYTPAETRLSRVLNGLAVVFALLTLLTIFLPALLFSAPLFVAPPFFVSNSAAGLVLLLVLAWLSAADVRRFRVMIYVLITGLLCGTAAFLGLLFSPGAAVWRLPLLVGAILCGGAALLTLFLLVQAQTERAPWLPWTPDKPLTRWEQVARIVLGVFGVLSLLAAIGSVLLPFFNTSNVSALAALLVNPIMIGASAIKLAVLGLCALLITRDVRRYTQDTQLITVLIIGNAASLVVILLLGILNYARFGDYSLAIAGLTLTVNQFMLGAALLDFIVISLLVWLTWGMNFTLLDHLGFLSPAQFRALEATAETLITGDAAESEIVPPHQIVLRTDSYLRSFRSDRLFLARLAVTGLQLSPLIWLQPPMNYLNPHARERFVDRRFKEEIIKPNRLYQVLNAVIRFVNVLLLTARGRAASEVGAALTFTGLLDAMMRFNMQLTYIGYYNDPRVWQKQADGKGLNYVPFSERPKNFPIVPRRRHPPLQVTTPTHLEREGVDVIDDADVVIIGSGAAGAILAEQLLQRGRRVLMLEKGQYVPPDEFNEDEVDMISRLYSDGALQLSQALRFTVLQGSCVGGTTVVNNAVCFNTPQEVLKIWNGRGATPVIHAEPFYAAQQQVRQRMHIGPIRAGTRQPLDGGVLNHGDGVITRAVQNYFANQPNPYKYDVVEANIVDCLGCGYCNIGCKYGRKLSMLDEVLPSAQDKHGADAFRILSEAQAVKLVEDGHTIREVHVRVGGKRQLIIRHPKTVIVSGGTVASSWLLMQSKIGEGRLPVGQGISFNMGSPLHARFNQTLNSYDGLQIAHYLSPNKDHPGFVYETWYNPPVAQALAMPGWLEMHFRNMQYYDQMAAVGVLVGTDATAYLAPALLTKGPDIVFQPSKRDMDTLVEALIMLGDILFAGGALEVYASTRSYRSYVNQTAVYTAQSEMERLRELVRHDDDILLGTGHPQGGNAIGASPKEGVVGADFKVFGYDNLYVCDASVFPTSTTVNPQLTVMTLAHYAAPFVDA